MQFILKSVGLVFVYLVSAKIGLAFGTVSNSATIFWPPGGIALAALLLGGLRYLPVVFIAAFLAGVMVNAPFVFGFGAAIGNAMETYIGYSLLKRFGKFDPALNQLNDLFAVFILGGLVAAIASATLGPLALLASGLINADALSGIMWRWWRADVLGVAFFTPLILLFVRKKPFVSDAARLRERALLWLCAFVLGQMIFIGWVPASLSGQHLVPAWLFPVLIWSGLRAGRRNTSLIQLMFLSQSLASAYLHVGYFADDFAHYGLSNFWIFAMLLATLGMALATLATAQRYAAYKTVQNAKLFEVSNDGVMIVDANNIIVSVNPAFTLITGYSADEVIGKLPSLLSSGRQSREFYSAMWQSINEHGTWNGEIWNRRKDGSAFLEQLSIHTIYDSRNRVESRLGVFSDITQQKATFDAVIHQSQHDYLTNLPNRFLLCDRFSQQLAFANRNGTKFAIIYLDLDEFKPVNDKLGHHVGDQLLIAVAERLTSLVREIDTVARFGGDEFAILVSEVGTIEDASTLAKKILTALSDSFILDGHTVKVSGSLGIALYPDHGKDMETVMRNADAAMYLAKQAGNNTYVIAKQI